MLPPWQDPTERDAATRAALDRVRSALAVVLALDGNAPASPDRSPVQVDAGLAALAQRFFELTIRAALLDPAAIPIADIAAAGGCEETFVELVGTRSPVGR